MTFSDAAKSKLNAREFVNHWSYCVIKGQNYNLIPLKLKFTDFAFYFHITVSQFRNVFLVSSILPKTTMVPQVELFSFIFLEELKTPKRHFKINWPLTFVTPNFEQVTLCFVCIRLISFFFVKWTKLHNKFYQYV